MRNLCYGSYTIVISKASKLYSFQRGGEKFKKWDRVKSTNPHPNLPQVKHTSSCMTGPAPVIFRMKSASLEVNLGWVGAF